MKLISTICLGLTLVTAPSAFAQWTVVNSATTDNLFGLYSIDANNVWVTGNNATVAKWNGTSWTSMGSIGVTQQRFSVWASSANNIYAGGAGTGNSLIQYNGTSWTNITAASGWGSGSVRSIWGSSANNVWITGGASGGAGRARRFNGTTWELKNNGLSATLSASNVYGIDANNVWIVGSTGSAETTGIAYKWNEAGNTWNAVLGDGINYPNFRGVYAADANNVWVVGGEGLMNLGHIYKWNGTSWTEQSVPNGTPTLHAIHGSGTSNIWAVGYNGTILKYNGTSWQAQSSGTTLDLQSVRVTGNSAIWAVGNSTTATNALILFSNQSTALPLSWGNIEGTQEGTDIKLSWTTLNEQNTRLFAVQHQDRAGKWTTIAEQPASGSSIVPRQYSHLHGQAMEGANYYRILQTDIDGGAHYSKVVRVYKKTAAAPVKLVSENPVTGGSLELHAQTATTADIFDASGKKRMHLSLQEGSNKIDVSALARGIYLLRSGTATTKIVIP